VDVTQTKVSTSLTDIEQFLVNVTAKVLTVVRDFSERLYLLEDVTDQSWVWHVTLGEQHCLRQWAQYASYCFSVFPEYIVKCELSNSVRHFVCA